MNTKTNKALQMQDWVTRVQKSMKKFEDEINTMSEDDVDLLIEKLRKQYSLLSLLRGVFSGKVILQGIDHDRLTKQI